MRTAICGKTATEIRKRKTKNTLDAWLHRLRDGDVSFSVFTAKTKHHWVGLAHRLFRRWTPPTGVSVEDVEQEILLSVWTLLSSWDSTRGVTLERYVVWNACTAAKAMLHKNRGANRSGSVDRNPTRGEVLITSHDDSPRSVAVDDGGICDRHLTAVGLARHAPTVIEGAILVRIAQTWDIRSTAMDLYADPDARIRLRLGSEEAAREFVRGFLKRTAIRIAVGMTPERKTS